MDYTLIIKITNNCNLNCAYCYHRRDISRHQYETMSYDMIECLIKEVLYHNNERATFIWHGGEPLLVGKDVFRFIVAKQKEHNVKNLQIRNNIQTNGTLLDAEYIQLLKEHGFHIGISIDGPFELHAKERNTSLPEYENIEKSLSYLHRVNARYGTLCVVGKHHIGQEKKILDFLMSHNIQNIGFLPCVVQSSGVVDEEQTISPTEYAQFLVNLFDGWINSKIKSLSVRNFDDAIRFALNIPAKSCTKSNCCDEYLTIAPDGKIYLCDDFSASDEHCVGHIEEGLEFIENTSAMQWLKRAMKMQPETCRKCKYYNGCFGGCKYRRWIRNNDMSEGSYYCKSTQILYSHVEKCLAKE